MTLLEEVKERLSVFQGLYDEIRVVDPVIKKVVNDVGEEDLFSHRAVLATQCFEHWGKSSMCKNCVSYKALKNNKTYVKIEKNKDKYYWTLAIPVKYHESLYIVELLRSVYDEEIYIDDEFEHFLEMKKSMFDLTNLAQTDSLTGVFNRRYLETQLEKDCIISRFHQEELCVLLFDIDYFKRINDTHGHQMGDVILKQFVSIIKSKLRQNEDWIARLGGEEFVIVLNKTSKFEAMNVAERIRKSVEMHCFGTENTKLMITCSGGVASSFESNENIQDLLDVADKKMYEAKINGRNRVE